MPRGACLSCRLPTPPLVLLLPHPPHPLPRRGRGRFKVISCKGLRPLHPRGRTRAALGKGANHAPGGGLIFLVACRPCLELSLSAPYPPTPLPRRGRGRPRLFLCKGLRPLHPRGLNPGGTCTTKSFCLFTGGAVPAAKERGDRGRGTSAFEMVLSPGAGIANAAGGLSFWSPACPAFCFPFCPLPRRGRIDARGRGA